MQLNRKMTEVKAALLLNQPFFAALFLDMMTVEIGKFPHIFPKGNETMATNGRKIWIDEDFLEAMSISESVFVTCHEIGHAMWRHMARGKAYQDIGGIDGMPFIPLVWNIAGDYVINDMLVKAAVGKMPKMGLLDAKYPYTMVVDDVYRDIMKDHVCGECGGTGKQQGKGGGNCESGDAGDSEGGDGGGSGDTDCPACGGSGLDGKHGRTLDHHVLEDDSGGPSEAEWKRAVASARDAAKAMGQMPAHLERWVNGLLEAKVEWNDKLRKSMAKVIGRDVNNWNRPHRRRYLTQGVIMPTYNGFGAGHIVFCVDTSGSMSDNELRQALGECDKILSDCNPKRVTLIGCDARVETVIDLGEGDRLADNIPRIGGGGGTSFIPPFEWCEENGVRPDTLVYFTDTGGTFPTDEPDFPVIWCCSSDWMTPPFGEVIMVEVANG